MSTTSRPHDARYLLMGFSRGILDHWSGWAAPGSVVVIEEPDVCRKKRVEDAVRGYPIVSDVVQLRYLQCDDVLEPAARLHRRHGFAAVVPGVEYSVVAAAAVAAAVGLPGAGVAAANALRDKIRLRELTTAGGMAAPAWREVHGPDDVRAFLRDGRCVLKPANRQASLGVRLLDPGADVEAAWRATVGADEPRQLPDRPLSWRYLVERRMTGSEFSVEALVRDGRVVFENVTRKSVLAGSHPVECGHTVPAALPDADRRRFGTAIRQLVSAIGFGTGLLHAEWFDTPEGLVLVECAGRAPGDRILELIDLAYHVRLVHAMTDLLAGRDVRLPGRASRSAAIRFLGAPAGTVSLVSGVEEVRARPEVVDVSVAVRPGDEVRSWQSSWDRIGHVIATEGTPGRAAAAARRAAAAVRVCSVRGPGAGEQAGGPGGRPPAPGTAEAAPAFNGR
ncbi:MAG TPA: ATP-grasp domain-containing protein [Kineosporiaceae bacterium]